ncbi:MAG: hypothetical protein WD206_07250 [Actinomycetota bacterium]
MPREGVPQKADRYLLGGRVNILYADEREIIADVRSDQGVIWRCAWAEGNWWCACPARGRCCHLAAVQRVVVRPTEREALNDDQ